MHKSRLLLPTVSAALILIAGATIYSRASGATSPSHDFDYEFGKWNVQVSRLTHDANGTGKWISYAGTHTVTPLWNGRANIGVLEIKGSAGSIEGLQLRLYNPATKQWSLSFASSVDGTLGAPSVGSFQNGVGIFRDTETIDGKRVLVRSESRMISQNAYRDVISHSSDGGKTWSPVWIATYSKV